MGAHARPEASDQPRRPEQRRLQRTGLFLLENLALAGSYALLGWLGHHLMLNGRLPIIWPLGGFALAVLLLRGASRWPAILLGAVLVSEDWLFKTGGPSSFPGHMSALLMGAVTALSTLVGAQFVRWRLGTGRWLGTVRGVAGFMLTAGLMYPVLATGVTLFSLRLSENTAPAPFQELCIWFIAHSTGALVFALMLLVFATPSRVLPRRSRWEAALLGMLYLAGFLCTVWLTRRFGVGGLLAYPPTLLLPWAVFRFGSRGAVFHLALWSVLLIVFGMSLRGAEGLPATFLQFQVRMVVVCIVVLLLAAAVEERHLLVESLEKERRGLERRVAERTRELARSLSLLHSSLESTADGLLVVDRQSRITVMNQRFAELWGVPLALLENSTNERLLFFTSEQVVDPEMFRRRVKYLYEHPEQESEDELKLKDGRIFQRFSRPQRLGAELIGRVWSFRDITVRRQVEAERDRLLIEENQARKAAEQSFREAQKALGLRDEFLAIAAHELKTPLTSMKVQLQHLERLLATHPDSAIQIARLRSTVIAASRQVRRLQALGDQLLDITRLTLGKIELRYEPLDFREFVEEQLEQHAEAASKAGSKISIESTGPLHGEWDRLRLEHIVGCLLSNAIKFGAGSPITIKLGAPDDRVCLQVIDRGIGIATEDHERIFQRLERAVDSRHYGGLGLGLWIVRESAEALGGCITVESAPGKGSIFTVELPRTRQPIRMRSSPPALEDHPPA
jgi:PAS domain S-box-containing protein